LQEFLTATVESQMLAHQQQIWDAFCELDKDRSGYITVDEARVIVRDVRPDKVAEWMAEVDKDGDGVSGRSQNAMATLRCTRHVNPPPLTPLVGACSASRTWSSCR